MPVKVAIIGGGPAGLAAAWTLARDTDTDYEVTLYQEDHLLGGKCAAVRAPHPEHPDSDRIEEHGIHILFGFYGQLMRILEDAYAETAGQAGPQGTVRPFATALTPNDFAFLAEEYPAGTWREPWRVKFPERAGHPWDTAALPDVSDLYGLLVERFIAFLEALASSSGSSPIVTGLLAVLEHLFEFVQTNPAARAMAKGTLTQSISDVLRAAWTLTQPQLQVDAVRRLWIGAYLAGTNLLGLIGDDIFFGIQPYESIDHLDYREWLEQSDPFGPGEVPDRLSWNSPPVRALYDVVFARSKSFAAGTMAQNALILTLGYRGHLSYRMNGSMGEVVMAPIYLALKDDVTFKFFHRATALTVADAGGGKVVQSVKFATTIATNAVYTPVAPVAIDGGDPIPSFPKEPNTYDTQPSSEHTIVRGTHYDHVILAVPSPAFDAVDPANLVADLVNNSPQFKQMVLQTTSSRTQVAQLWLDETLAELGWAHPLPGGQIPMLIAYARQANSWADMSHLVDFERHSAGGPKTIAYLADELLDAEGATAADVAVNIKKWLDDHAPGIWPAFDYDALHADSSLSGADRLGAQYFRANTEGWHRYVLSEKVKINSRLATDESGFDNLFMAGDWVKSTLNCGCVEAAVSSGVAAARAIQQL